MKKNRVIKLLLLIVVCIGLMKCLMSCDWQRSWPEQLQTVPEKTAYTETSTHAQVIAFLSELQSRSPLMHIEKMAESIGGREVPLVVLADPPVMSPEEALQSGKPVIYIEGNIHAGEVDGKEALLEIMREILLGRNRHLLDNQILLICPIYNADGNDKMRPGNRPEDDGPEMAGVRASGEGYDLNRDGIKADALETKGLLENVLNRWDPVLVVDLHTTDGSWHGYSLTYSPPSNPAGDRSVSGYLMDTMLPTVTENLDSEYGMKTFLYGVFSGYPPTAWYHFGHKPNIIVNYIGLRNRMAIISECFARDPFEKRIVSSRHFVTAIIRYTSEYGTDMADIVKNADDQTVADVKERAGTFEKGVDFEMTCQDNFIDLLVYEQLPVIDPVTGQETWQLTDNMITVSGVQICNKYAPEKLSTFPRGYLFPPECKAAAEKLMQHGLQVDVLSEPLTVEGEEFVVTSFVRRDTAFQKHLLATIEGYFQTCTSQFPAGTYHVDLAQPLANLAFYMLEPESDDGLLKWNFFDDYLIEHGAETGETVFPVFKYYERMN